VASILRVRTAWSGAQGVPYLSTHYFTRVDAGSASAAADAVAALWTGCAEVISNTLDWSVEPEVAVIDSVTGSLTGVDNVGGGNSGSGTSESQILPFTTQGLLRLGTTSVVSGRILKGHTFIPGPTEASSEGGVPDSAYKTVVAGAYDDLAAVPDAELIVWSRTHGATGVVASGSCWEQWAALRSRRD